jgi:hypothetical protein
VSVKKRSFSNFLFGRRIYQEAVVYYQIIADVNMELDMNIFQGLETFRGGR